MGDPTVMRALGFGVGGRRHGDGLRNVPVRRYELHVLPVAVDQHLATDDDVDIDIRVVEINLYRPGGPFGQHDLVNVELRQGAALRDHGIAFAVDLLGGGGRVEGRVVLDDQHRRGVVVDDLDHHAGCDQPVIGAAVDRGRALHDVVLDVDAAHALGQVVVGGRHEDGLRDEPVGAVEEQRHAHIAAIDPDTLAAGIAIGFGQRHRRRGDPDGVLGRARQDDLVAVHDQAAVGCDILEHAQLAAFEQHQDTSLVVIGDDRRDVLNEDVLVARVVRGDRVQDQAGIAFQAVRDDRDRTAHRHLVELRAADVEHIGTEPADNLDHHILAGALDEEGVVALERIDGDFFDADIGDEQPGAEHAGVGHHEIIAELGADHRDGVEAVAAVDADRRIDIERDEVCPLAAIDVNERCLRVARVDQDECADAEGVVVVLTEQEQLGLVGIDREVVLAGAAEQRRVETDAN